MSLGLYIPICFFFYILSFFLLALFHSHSLFFTLSPSAFCNYVNFRSFSPPHSKERIIIESEDTREWKKSREPRINTQEKEKNWEKWKVSKMEGDGGKYVRLSLQDRDQCCSLYICHLSPPPKQERQERETSCSVTYTTIPAIAESVPAISTHT